MSSVYGYANVGLATASSFSQLCVGSFSFNYEFQPILNKIWDATNQIMVSQISPAALVNRKFTIQLTASIMENELLRHIFQTGQDNLQLDPGQTITFSGVAYTANDKEILISSTKCLPIDISPLQPNSEITITLEVLDLPRIVLLEN